MGPFELVAAPARQSRFFGFMHTVAVTPDFFKTAVTEPLLH